MPSNFANAIQVSLRQNYNLTIKSTIPIGTGAMSTTMRVATNRGTLFLKIYKSARNQKSPARSDLQRIAFTHAVQTFLHQEDFPVPRLLPNNSGETFSVCDSPLETGVVYALSEFIEGFDYDVANSEQLRASGEILGRLHQQLLQFQSPTQFAGPPLETEIFIQLQERLSRLHPVIEENLVPPTQIDSWIQEVEVVKSSLGALHDTQHEQDWLIHGDYRAQNLKFDDMGICGILDLDTACPASRIYDLGYALIFFSAVYQDTPLTPSQQSIFLRAYEDICPLSDAEREMLPTHLRLAFLRGMTLWLDLYYFAGMSERTRPWIQGYLQYAQSFF
ncbi:phosphotransferase [Candidatus Poribacteria bacterium]|nr:phosphotransferase [Candidatus Poribacteria bacterium]